MSENEKKMVALEERAKRLKVNYTDLSQVELSQDHIAHIPFDLARQFTLVPVSVNDGRLTVAMENPTDLYQLEQLETRTKMSIKPVLADTEDIKKAILELYSKITPDEIELPALNEPEFSQLKVIVDEDTIAWFRTLITNMLNRNSSDVHIESYRGEVRVRYRIDGVISENISLPKQMESQINNLLKSLSRMQLVAKKTPQEGIIDIKVRGREMVLRVGCLNTLHGDRFILRVMDESHPNIKIKDLGLEKEDLKKLKELVKRRQGLILISGPTGSGVYSTLHSLLHYISKPEVNVISIEDPIEASLLGVNQIEVNEKNMSMEDCIRSALRHDPDIIMISKITDRSIAQTAMEAALTGHLVLAGVFARDAIDAVSRLRDMGIDPYFISTTLLGVTSQRLVRLVCPRCAKPYEIQPSVIKELEDNGIKEPYNFRRGEGCSHCLSTGYKGRVGIFEVYPLSDEFKAMIIRKEPDKSRMEEQAKKDGLATLYHNGLKKVADGLTTYDEFKRVLIQ